MPYSTLSLSHICLQHALMDASSEINIEVQAVHNYSDMQAMVND